jgi:hypothetical protein
MVLANLGFHTRKNFSENYPKFGESASPDLGHAVAQLVEAVRYKSEGHWFDSRLRYWKSSLT